MSDLTIIIPARNEIFLSNTIDDILQNMRGNTEIIAVLDGEWPYISITDNPKVTLLHYNEAIGQRAATNEAAKLSTSKYLMKVDAHCSFDEGFDVKMMDVMQDNWTMVPIMRNLHAFNWVCIKCGAKRYQGPTPVNCPSCDNTKGFKMEMVWVGKNNPQSTSYCFDSEPHFQYFNEFKHRPEGKGNLTETMSLQGSCFMVTRDKYFELNLCDEAFGSWGSQGIEISMKTATSGGKVMVNHKTWYAHMFRTQGGDFGFPYKLSGRQVSHAKKYAKDLFFNNKWDKQIYPLSKIIKKFWPIPGWTDEDLSNLLKNEMTVERPGIYSIVNNTNGHIYIGSATNLARRFGEHLRMFHRNDHENKHLQNAWNKYGESVFSFNIEYFCKNEELVTKEQKFIDDYKEKIGWDNMYNMNPIAYSALGHRHTEESLLKMSIQQSGENNGFYGKHHSEETKQKISEAHLGQKAGIVYYTDNRLDPIIMKAVQNSIKKSCPDCEIISVSLQPIDFGTKNIALNEKRGYLTMFKQILAGLEASTADVVFLCEHDVLYNKSHFDFTPPKRDVFYYNDNRWHVDTKTGRTLFYHAQSTSQLCADRKLLVEHYRKRVERVEKEGFSYRLGFEPGNHPYPRGVDFYTRESYFSEYPNIDIRHTNNLTKSRWTKEEFRNKKNLWAWTEGDSVPGWSWEKGKFYDFLVHFN
jgi:group I intron endonuclease